MTKTHNEGVTSVLVVFAAAVPGHVVEFRKWYDEVHIPEVLEKFPEVLSFERHDVDSTSVGGDPAGTRRAPDSVAVYVIQGDAKAVWRRMAAPGALGTSKFFDYSSIRAVYGNSGLAHFATSLEGKAD